MKRIVFIIVSCLVALSLLRVCAFADEVSTEEEKPVETILEESTEVEEEPREDVEQEEAKIEETDVNKLVEKLSNASFWVTAGTSLLAAVGVLATVKKNLDNIKILLGKKADSESVLNALSSAKNDITAEYAEKLKELKEALDAEKDENKKMSAILAIAFANMKGISESAKAEIVSLLNGVHEATGTVSEIAKKAQEYIDKAEETAEKVSTPALDALQTNYITME